MFAGAYDSSISQKPSRNSIETIEECEILAISIKDFEQLLLDKPNLNLLLRKILEERFIALHDLFTAQILDSPEERYIKLQKERPDLLSRKNNVTGITHPVSQSYHDFNNLNTNSVWSENKILVESSDYRQDWFDFKKEAYIDFVKSQYEVSGKKTS